MLTAPIERLEPLDEDQDRADASAREELEIGAIEHNSSGTRRDELFEKSLGGGLGTRIEPA